MDHLRDYELRNHWHAAYLKLTTMLLRSVIGQMGLGQTGFVALLLTDS